MKQVKVHQSLCRAAVADDEITPPVGMYHRMWGAATHDRSTGVHRPLLASVLLLAPLDGTSRDAIAVVSLDHCILADDELARIRKAVAAETTVPAERVHITLTHTHGAGLMMRDRADLPGGEMIGPYLDALAKKIAELAIDAEELLMTEPTVITYATGRCDLAVNRDFYDEQAGKFVCGFNPQTQADDALIVARLSGNRPDSTFATIVNYACHPTTLAWQNTLISPDFLGAMRKTVDLAGETTPIFFQGASGELAPREQYTGDPEVADRNGRKLAYAALATLESMSPVGAGTRFAYRGPVVSGALLGTWAWEKTEANSARWHYRSWDVQLGYRAGLPTLAEANAERDRLIAEEQAAQMRTDMDETARRDLHAKVEQATRQVTRIAALPKGDTFPLRVTVLHLGEAIWIWVAGEHYSALQTELRNRFPNHTLLITTITDGWQPGYLPTKDTYGKGIYQEQIALVERGSLEWLIDEITTAISQMAGAAQTGSAGE